MDAAARWRVQALRLACGLCFVDAFAASVITGGAAPNQSSTALMLEFCHAFRGALLANHLAGKNPQQLLATTFVVTLFALIFTLVLFASPPASISTAELLGVQAFISVLFWTTGCVALLLGETNAEVDLPALEKSEWRNLHLQRLQHLTVNVMGTDDLEGIEAQICIICLGDFDRGEMLLRLKCKHLHHAACIQRWFLNGGGCPMRCVEASSTLQ